MISRKHRCTPWQHSTRGKTDLNASLSSNDDIVVIDYDSAGFPLACFYSLSSDGWIEVSLSPAGIQQPSVSPPRTVHLVQNQFPMLNSVSTTLRTLSGPCSLGRFVQVYSIYLTIIRTYIVISFRVSPPSTQHRLEYGHIVFMFAPPPATPIFGGSPREIVWLGLALRR
jgi:hypothetical protein